MKRALVFSVLFSVLCATTINIPSDYTTIQEGIDASADGDTVLVEQGIYVENLILANEIVLASYAIYDDLDSEWFNNENINNTIISGALTGSCLVIRDGNIEPTVTGFTFQDGTGTSMIVEDCGAYPVRSGGAILIYKAYPTINYNRFINNGFSSNSQRDIEVAVNGGAISQYSTEEVEFDEDRNHSSGQSTFVDFADFDAVETYILESARDSDESNSNRTVPPTMNIQNNYFENNSSGDGKNFYSHGYEGSIDVSYSVFDDIDCASNTVNEYVLRSIENQAEYVQNEISGTCIEADIFYVGVNGSDNNDGTESAPLSTIGHALSMVKDEGTTTIHVQAGTYSRDISGEIFPIVVPDNVHLIGEDPATTILDADADETNQAAVLIIKEVANVRVENLTLTGGSSEGHGCTGGGGLLITANDMFNLDTEDGTNIASTYPVIENVIIENNHSHNGGGMAFFRVNGPVLNNVIIRNNTATAFGGGIFSYVCEMTMTGVTITGNQTQGQGQGGGMMLANSRGTYDNMTITNNTAVGAHGGGIWTNNSGGPDSYGGWMMTNSVISGNESSYFGGGINFAWSHPRIFNCTISGNTSGWGGGGIGVVESGFTLKESIVSDNFSSGGGGGILAWGDSVSVVIEDCIVTGNTTGNNGGGIMINGTDNAIIRGTSVVDNHAANYVGGIYVLVTPTTIYNNTISGNTSGNGGAIGILEGGHVELTNSIVWDNPGPGNFLGDGTGSLDITYSDIDGGYEGEGNIDANPLFKDPDNGDYRLLSESDCINAGTADIDGDGNDDIANYFDSAPDMGAFEFFIEGPTGLQTSVGNTSVTLTWDSFTDDDLSLMFYKVDRSTDSLFTNDLVTNIAQENSFTDTELVSGVEYYYRVASFTGFWSLYSDVISVVFIFMDISDSDGVPTSYYIHQNYPNPFNPVTTLRYDIPEDINVKVTIYDMIGREVNRLVSGQQSAGYKIVQWNGTNNLGEAVSAGTYLYKIQAGNFRQTKRMVLLK